MKTKNVVSCPVCSKFYGVLPDEEIDGFVKALQSVSGIPTVKLAEDLYKAQSTQMTWNESWIPQIRLLGFEIEQFKNSEGFLIFRIKSFKKVYSSDLKLDGGF